MSLTNCSMCYLQLAESEVISHVVRCHKFDPNFIIYCNQPGCGASYKKWSSFQKHVKREHQMNLNNIDNENIANVVMDDPKSYEDETNNSNDESFILNKQDLLRWHATMFVINLKESCSIPQTTVEKIIEGAQQLFENIMCIMKTVILDSINEETEAVSRADILQAFNCDGLDLFREVSTSAKIISFLDKCGMVKPEKREIGSSQVWSKDKLVTRKDYAYIVPFLRNLEFYLNNYDVLTCVDNPKSYDGTIRTVLDGSYYRSHEVFKRDRNALSIIVYYDDVEFANPLGAKTKKLSMFYWTLGNIYPELRSSLRSINLLAITSHANLKTHGAEKVLSDFLNDLALLGSEEGVLLEIKGVQRKFTGLLNFVAGDTLASAYLGGFKEGVGNAYRPCRTCFADKASIQKRFSEELFVIRNMETHITHCEDVNTFGLTKQAREFWSAFHGVNFKSAFMNLDNTDVTKIFPHDFMHIMFEGGTLAVEIKNFLTYCIIEKKRFTLQDLNANIANFDFGHLIKDKPSPIDQFHLINGLKQGAAQMNALGHLLPFLIGQWLTNEDRNHLSNYIILLQIINLAMSFELVVDDAFLLKRMIRLYLTNLTTLYPNQNKTPKMHYLVHLCSQILLYGPIRQQSCFRFEGAHAYFKQLILKLKNYMNVPYTLASRRQAKMASQLISIPGTSSRKFLYSGDVVKSGEKIYLKDHNMCNVLTELLQVEDDALVMFTPLLYVHGTMYRKHSVILLQNDEDNFPKFGQITQIIVYADRKILLYEELETLSFEETLNAYKVQIMRPMINGAMCLSNLIFPHPLSRYEYQSKVYVILFNSMRTEFGM